LFFSRHVCGRIGVSWIAGLAETSNKKAGISAGQFCEDVLAGRGQYFATTGLVDALSRINQDGRRAAQIIENLRALTKKSEPQFRRLDINGAIQEILALTRTELTQHNLVLHIDLSTGDRTVFGDRVQLQQVMLNLIINGIEAMSVVVDRPKVLTISSEPVETGDVLVAVKDTGAGIDPATADRIFESFFTTKPNGMGMGLSICRSIIEAHGGRFWASPNTPHGAVFQFTVPADGREPPAPRLATSSSSR
jgi:signal transduction histidine kinase